MTDSVSLLHWPLELTSALATFTHSHSRQLPHSLQDVFVFGNFVPRLLLLQWDKLLHRNQPYISLHLSFDVGQDRFHKPPAALTITWTYLCGGLRLSSNPESSFITTCDNVTKEMIKQIFNEVLKQESCTPETWHRIQLKVICKKSERRRCRTLSARFVLCQRCTNCFRLSCITDFIPGLNKFSPKIREGSGVRTKRWIT